MSLRTIAFSAGLALACASPSYAVTLGQPLFVAEADGTGSVLDFFMGGAPSGLKEVDASATITQEFGADGFVGQSIDYSMNLDGEGTLSVGDLDLDIFTWTAGFAGAVGEEFADTGLITTTFLVEFPVVSFAVDPGTGETVFTLDLDPFGTDLLVESREDGPFVEIGVNIFYDGALPTRNFVSPFGVEEFIEGQFAVSRIEVGLIGGEPVAPVPLPAGGLLLLTGLIGAARFARKPRA